MYSSTSAAYVSINFPPFAEYMERNCLNPYSVSKCCGEDLCRMYWDLFGLETIIFRYFNVYGERQPRKGPYAPVIGIFKKQLEAKQPMTVVGDGLQTRDYVHVSDVVNANILAATSSTSEVVGEIFNIGTGEAYSVMDLVWMMGGQFPDYEHLSSRIGEVRHSKADFSKTREYLGWTPKIKLEEWLS